MKESGACKLLKCVPILLILWSCLQFGEFIDPSAIDVTPPVCSQVLVTGERGVEIVFDENVYLDDELKGPERLQPIRGTAAENRIKITLGEKAEPGEEFVLSGFVRDTRGNETGFSLPVYGYNSEVPVIIINEFTTQGSSSHPDFIELLVLCDGNTGGICLYEGIPGECTSRFVFPQCEVKTGDYLVVHCKPQGLETELTETGNIDESGGIDAFPYARDFWVKRGDGLSGNNGVLSLYSSPGGNCLDALIYSNRTSASDENYRGFGSTKMLTQAEFIFREGEWTGDGETVRPEDGINPDDSTATRSISRMQAYTDANAKTDWHITPSGGYTPGKANTNEIYR